VELLSANVQGLSQIRFAACSPNRFQASKNRPRTSGIFIYCTSMTLEHGDANRHSVRSARHDISLVSVKYVQHSLCGL